MLNWVDLMAEPACLTASRFSFIRNLIAHSTYNAIQKRKARPPFDQQNAQAQTQNTVIMLQKILLTLRETYNSLNKGVLLLIVPSPFPIVREIRIVNSLGVFRQDGVLADNLS